MFGKAILYAEDNPDDVAIFRRAFARAALRHSLYTVEDGQAAIDWLCGKNGYRDREAFPLPDLLIVDLNMPKQTGFDVLKWARSDPRFQSLPIVVLSSSDEPADLRRAFDLGATTYFVKSDSNKDVIEFLKKS